MAGHPGIRLLAAEAQLQLKSSASLNSVKDVITGLVKNSLDAGGRNISIELDLAKGNCSVEDDGFGIPAKEFVAGGGLGLMYHTSKFATPSHLHGNSGCFLASVSSLSFVSIASRYVKENSESFAVFQHSIMLNRQINVAELERRLKHEHGTRVTVRELFGNLPVRSRHFALQFSKPENVNRELEVIKASLAALALAWPMKIRINVADQQNLARRRFSLGTFPTQPDYKQSDRERSRASSFQLEYLHSIFSHAGYVLPSSINNWTMLSAKTSRIFIRAAISIVPAPSRQFQFISVGIHPLEACKPTSQILYGGVNEMFLDSTFGSTDEESRSGPEQANLNRQKAFGRTSLAKMKGADRWPIFYIRIEPQEVERSKSVLDSKEDDREANVFFEKTLQLLQSMMLEFLQQREFLPKSARESPTKRHHQPSNLRDLSSARASEISLGSGLELVHSRRLRLEQSEITGPKNEANMSHHFATDVRRMSRCPRPFSLHSKMRSGRPRTEESATKDGSMIESKDGNNTCDRGPTPSALPSKASSLEFLPEVQASSTAKPPPKESAAMAGATCTELTGQEHVSLPKNRTDAELQEQETTSATQQQDGALHWIDPMSGKKIRIDCRTGLLLPEESLLTPASSSRWRTPSFRRPSTLSRVKGGRVEPLSGAETSEPASDTWVGNLLRGCRKSAFRNLESPIPCCGAPLTEDTNQNPTGPPSRMRISRVKGKDVAADVRLSKTALRHGKVLGQVDGKFILVVLSLPESSTNPQVAAGEPLDTMVLIDQHAADERVRVEELFSELNSSTPVILTKPIHLATTPQESERFWRAKDSLHFWGLRFDIKQLQVGGLKHHLLAITDNEPEQAKGRVVITALPTVIAERCRLQPKLLIDMVRSEVWARSENQQATIDLTREALRDKRIGSDGADAHSWLHNIAHCPRGIIEIVNSRACRSAIMFNDVLTLPECMQLVQKLSRCAFPFQCAHGRPSMVILGRLDDHGSRSDGLLKDRIEARSPDQGRGFIQAFDKWRQRVSSNKHS